MTRNDTIAFLTCVLPGEGFYCAVAFDTAHPRPGVDRPRQKFFQSIDELADFLLGADQQGRTVYHACASYKDARTGRKQTNAAYAAALWLDVDCQIPDDASPRNLAKYPDKETAARAVLVFCSVVGLPAPLFLDSGGGIHCYWPLETVLDPGEWNMLAAGLKTACVRHELRADPSRTADIASILRTPGTYNRKHGETLVVYDSAGLRRYPVSAFRHLAEQAERGSPPAPQVPLRRAAVGREPRRSVIDRIEAATSYAAVYADTVADRCAQLRAFRESGDIPEPQWYACLGVLSRCADGEAKAHEWSANGFDGYNRHETSERYARSLALTGATTCAKFEGINPDGCRSCPYAGRINSPISVPSDPLDVRVTNSDPRSVRTPFNGGETRNGYHAAEHFVPAFGGIELPALRKPFKWNTKGSLCLVTEDTKGDPVEMAVSDFPVYLDTVQTGELDPTRFSYKLQRWLPREGWREILIDARLMFGASGSAELAERGVVINDHKYFLNYVRAAVTEFHEEEETHVRYDQFGWKNDNSSFLYGSNLYTTAGPVQAIGAKEVVQRSQWVGPKKGGSLDAWTEAADSLFAQDMEAYSAIVLASFAAPLMRFQSQDEGGAIIHLFTPGSGQGKTTALTGAWTVWGTKEGLSLTNDDTKVSKPIAIGTLANLPVIYDELRDRDPEVIKRFVVMFTEGRDRMRGMTDGTIRHTKANWQTILLSAANQSLIDQLQGEGVDAPAFRVLELSSTLPTGIDKTKGDRLKRILNENAGHAGDAYLRYITQPAVLMWIKTALEQWTQEIWTHTRLGSEHRFRVRAIGAMMVAAAIVRKLEILHFNSDRILEWMVKGITSVSNRGTVSGQMQYEGAVTAFGSFINAHLGETLIVADKFKPKQVLVPIREPHNRLSIRFELKPQRVFIAASVFHDWAIKAGMSPRHILDALEQQKAIVTRKRLITLSGGTTIPGAQVACIEVNAAHPIMSGLVASVEELEQNNAASN